LTQFASAKAGLILANLNPAYQAPELQFSVNEAGCRALVIAERFKSVEFLPHLQVGCTRASWGVIDAQGYCNITGRLKDMLIRGRKHIPP
jgi:acyl-CoA synthetase (AMP-forming)/AMP-acid ligase II